MQSWFCQFVFTICQGSWDQERWFHAIVRSLTPIWSYPYMPHEC